MFLSEDNEFITIFDCLTMFSTLLSPLETFIFDFVLPVDPQVESCVDWSQPQLGFNGQVGLGITGQTGFTGIEVVGLS